MTPDELRELGNDPHFPNPGFWHDRLHAAADAWEASIEAQLDARIEADALRKRLEEAEKNHIERKHIPATPDDGYPLRILRVYRADCDMRWADTSDGDVGNPLTVALNEMQDKRAAILDRAIAALAGEEKPDGWVLSDGHRAGHG